MANLPRLGRAWQRFSSLPRPAPAGQPTSDQQDHHTVSTESEIARPPPTTQTLQPFEPNPPPKVTSLPSSPIRESPRRLSSPVKKLASPSSSPKYKPTTTRVASPPATKPAPSSPIPAYKHHDGGRRVSPTASPKTFKPAQTSPPPSSPKYRQPAAPLSPLTLPRSEVKPAAGTITRSRSPPEVEQKSILYQKTVEKPAKSDRQLDYSSGKPTQKQQADVINITGENVGAVMHISQSSEGAQVLKKKQREGHGYENDERKTGAIDGKEKKLSSLPMKSFLNSNFQAVNNSLLYNSSCSHRDPGLHLAFSRKPTDDETISDSRR